MAARSARGRKLQSKGTSTGGSLGGTKSNDELSAARTTLEATFLFDGEAKPRAGSTRLR